MRLLSILFALCSSVALAGPSKIAEVEVKLSPKLLAQASGVRTLFITVFDAKSPRPMPYGAMKVDLSKDAGEQVYKGNLDTDIVRPMGGGEVPKLLRIKARLDKDGGAGPDSSGDLVGVVNEIQAGAKVTITIDKVI